MLVCKQLVVQFVLDFFVVDVLFFQLWDDGCDCFFFGFVVQVDGIISGVNGFVGFSKCFFVDVIIRDNFCNWQVKFGGEFVVMCIVCWYCYDGVGVVVGQNIVSNKDWNLFVVDWVNSIGV